MNMYKEINDIILCTDMVRCGKKLIHFANAALLEKNRASIVKHFHEQLKSAFIEYVFDSSDSRFWITRGRNAVSVYLALTIPKSSPVKTLKAIQSLGEYIASNFMPPIGNAISEKRILEIMDYLDNKYDFSKKVFSKNKAVFALLDCSHKKYDSECLVTTSENGDVSQHLFLYHLNSDENKNAESVFFHELAHTLHARYFGNLEVPENIILLLKEVCFPTIDSLSKEQQSEVFADVLSMGLMYEGPFYKYDPFSRIHEDDKKIFKQMADHILNAIV